MAYNVIFASVSNDIFSFSCVHKQCLWRLHYIVMAYNIIFDSVSIVYCTSILIRFAFHRRWSRLFYPWKFGLAFSSPAFSTLVLFMVPRFPFPRFQRPRGSFMQWCCPYVCRSTVAYEIFEVIHYVATPGDKRRLIVSTVINLWFVWRVLLSLTMMGSLETFVLCKMEQWTSMTSWVMTKLMLNDDNDWLMTVNDDWCVLLIVLLLLLQNW